MRRLLFFLPVLLTVPWLSGCLPLLETCTAPGDPDTVWSDPDLCTAPCFVDEDRDGHGAVPASGKYWDTVHAEYEWGSVEEARAACLAAGHAVLAGDCDDTDPRRFLGAREVCDGQDNDCHNPDPATGLHVEEPVFGEEPIPGEEGLYSCSTPDTYLQLFMLAGTTVGGKPVGPSGVVELDPGQQLDATFRIGALVPADQEGLPVAGGLAMSWQDAVTGFLPIIDNVGDPDETFDDGVYRIYERSITGLSVPQNAPPGESYLVTLAATQAPDPLYIGSLTFPWYCYGDENWDYGTPPCPPVWGFEVDKDLYTDLDLVDMDTLDLAGCVDDGQARLPTLAYGHDGHDYCQLDPDDPDCDPIYEPMTVGCTYLELVVRQESP